MSETDTQPAVSEAVIVAEIVEEDRVDFEEPEEDLDEDGDYDDDDYERATVVLREVIGRQLIACRTLSTQVTDAATDVTATLVESPARVIAAVREGATLPTAFGLTGDTLTDAALEAGGRIRAAVAGYVNSQSALPNAVITGTAEIAGTAVRAQGSIASSAFDAAFTVATVATRGDDVRDVFDEEWRGFLASVAAARDDVEDALSVARHRVRGALPVLPDES
jgi:hypothetical protein